MVGLVCVSWWVVCGGWVIGLASLALGFRLDGWLRGVLCIFGCGVFFCRFSCLALCGWVGGVVGVAFLSRVFLVVVRGWRLLCGAFVC